MDSQFSLDYLGIRSPREQCAKNDVHWVSKRKLSPTSLPSGYIQVTNPTCRCFLRKVGISYDSSATLVLNSPSKVIAICWST